MPDKTSSNGHATGNGSNGESGGTVLKPRISRSCDQCKARKVRCIRDSASDFSTCKNCLKRQTQCHFSHTKRRLRVPESGTSPVAERQISLSSPKGQPLPAAFSPSESVSSIEPPLVYIDYMLESRNTKGFKRGGPKNSIFKSHENFVASSNLAFFSESRIRSVSARLGHTKLRDLIETIGTVVDGRLNRGTGHHSVAIKFRGPSSPLQITPATAASYIEAYFSQVHPQYPFLEHDDFVKNATRADLAAHLAATPAFSALYHTVLALGCQYTDGGSFDPGKGKAWKLFQVALGLMPELLLPHENISNVQAITAMAIFALNMSCMQIEETLISEASRMAQCLHYHRSIHRVQDETAHQRVFWTIYCLEKSHCFFSGRASMMSDGDIGCPIPPSPTGLFGGFDWPMSAIRFSRLLSRAYDMLFSISSIMKSTDQYYVGIDRVNEDLEKWRLEIPPDFRPGEQFRPQNLGTPAAMMMGLRAHYSYYQVVMSICRLTLHVGADGPPTHRSEECKKRLMTAARAVIELTRYIDAEPYTPISIIASTPLSALFILFDFVIHNPYHPETFTNLALLEVAGGHFARLEYTTGGSLPSSLLSDFAHIARQYVRDVQAGKSPWAPNETRQPAQMTGSTTNTNTNEYAAIDRAGDLPAGMAYQPSTLANTSLSSLHSSNRNNNNNQHGSLTINENPGLGGGTGGAMNPPAFPAAGPQSTQLFYPTTDFQPLMSGEFPAGFDITNLFDAVLPDYMGL